MSSVKANLKLARDSINKKEFDRAYDAANQVLLYDSSNYNGLVFLGVASLELGKFKESEDAYRAAIRQNEDQPLAWQGITRLYERAQRWDEYARSLLKLADLYSGLGDAVKCAENLSKYIEFQKEHGSRRDVAEALSLLLESSPYYPTLANLPEPDASSPTASTVYDIQIAIHNNLPTLEEIIRLTEETERDTITQEIQKRRTRIDAPPLDILKEQVKREVWSTSKLEALYTEVLNHPNTSDQLRRSTEASLLQRKRDRLVSTHSGDPQKEKLRSEVMEMVNGMVLLRIPNEVAWTIYFEMQDVEILRQYDLTQIRTLLEILPDCCLARMWRTWLLFEKIPESDEDDSQDAQVFPENEEILDMAMELLSEMGDSALLHRIVAALNWTLQDYQAAIKLSEAALRVTAALETNFGISLSKHIKAINVILACSLVHLYPPKYHARALRSLDSLIDEDPNQLDCRMARGYVHEFASRWDEAKVDFDQAVVLAETSDSLRIEAAEESAWCLVQLGEAEAGIQALNNVIEELETLADREMAQARAWWRLGKATWNIDDESTFSQAYRLWITALKRSTSFAPAYTSLGIYYADYVKPPDPTRASKCFQKAFELDPREAEAARRLAEGFVDEREWDLADIVARRTIEGEGGSGEDSKGPGDGVSSRHKPTNVWAWKVVGLVAMINKNYTQAIDSFQVAIRSHMDDGITWLRLGEAYASAGRHTASLRALERASQLRPDDPLCQFQIAEVTRDLGDFQAAINLLNKIISSSPTDVVAHASRCATRLALSRHERNSGFLERAFVSCVDTIKEGVDALKVQTMCTGVLWKVIGDATFELSRWPIDEEIANGAVEEALSILVDQLIPQNNQLDERLRHLINLEKILANWASGEQNIEREFIAGQVSAAISNYCIHLAGSDEHVQAASCYDLALRLQELAFAHGHLLGADNKQAALELATEYCKRAIRIQSTEPSYWNCLGSISLDLNPKLSQHAFIRAIQCEPKNPLLWCNIGLLYIKHSDLQLAQEAFHRAQILDPDYAMSWVGQAIVASNKGDVSGSVALLEHAVSLSADMPIPNLEFASRTFRSLQQKSGTDQSNLVISAFFSLERCLLRRPNDVMALHLAALISERLNLFERAATFARRSATLLEKAYERSEDPQTARQYAVTQSTLGRILLTDGDFVQAAASFETVLSLVDQVNDSSDLEALKLRVQAHTASGLASLLSGDAETAISSFESGLEEAPADMKTFRNRLTVLLAQTMWVLGTPESRDMARSILLQSIESDPKGLEATLVLGGIATLLDDDALLDATLAEIVSLSPQERRQLDHLRKVDALLLRHHLIQGSLAEALQAAQQAVELDPSNEKSKLQLSEVLLQQSKPSTLLEILKADSTNIPILSSQLRLTSLAKIENREEDSETSMRDMQKAVALTPWDEKNWLGLAYAQSQKVKSS